MRTWGVAPFLCLLLLLPACSEDRPPTPPSEPLAMAGVYTTEIPWKDFKAFKRFEVPRKFEGEWILTIEPNFYRLEGEGFLVTEDSTITDEKMSIHGIPAPNGPFNCYRDGERLSGEGAAVGTYLPSLSGDVLTLELEEELCPFRDVLLERDWTRTD